MTSMKKQQVIIYFSAYLNDLFPVISNIKAHLYSILDVQPKSAPFQPIRRDLPSIVGSCKKSLDDLKRVEILLKGYCKAIFFNQQKNSSRRINSTASKRTTILIQNQDELKNREHQVQTNYNDCRKKCRTEHKQIQTQEQYIKQSQDTQNYKQKSEEICHYEQKYNQQKQIKIENTIRQQKKHKHKQQQELQTMRIVEHQNVENQQLRVTIIDRFNEQEVQIQLNNEFNEQILSNQVRQMQSKEEDINIDKKQKTISTKQTKSKIESVQVDSMIKKQRSNMFEIRHQNMECLNLIKDLRHVLFRSQSLQVR